MTVVERILRALGGATEVARETGFPVQTVHDWKTNGNIPHWRRSDVIAVAQRKGKSLDPDLVAYLASRERSRREEPAKAA